MCAMRRGDSHEHSAAGAPDGPRDDCAAGDAGDASCTRAAPPSSRG